MMKNNNQYISPEIKTAHYTAQDSLMGLSQVGNKEGVTLHEEERRNSSSSSWGDVWGESDSGKSNNK